MIIPFQLGDFRGPYVRCPHDPLLEIQAIFSFGDVSNKDKDDRTDEKIKKVVANYYEFNIILH